MSPVSRGRKTKSKKKDQGSGPGRSGNTATLRQVAALLTGPVRGEEPAWFEQSVEAVLASDAPLGAGGPAALEQVVCELLGEQMHTRMAEPGARGLWFDWFAETVASVAADQVLAARGDLAAGTWKAPWRVLRGLLAIGSGELRAQVGLEVDRCAAVLGPLGEVPSWLAPMTAIRATGEAWHLQDENGTRQAVIAAYSYPGDLDRSVFLFDLDVADHTADLVSAGVHPDVQAAATAWRSSVGDTAGTAEPTRTTDFRLLAQVSLGDHDVVGDESRDLLDNWFRAPRRIAELTRTR